MKTKILLILIAGILIGAAAVYFIAPSGNTRGENVQEFEGQLYSCGMHPEVISDKPGDCPICGMTLTPIKSTEKSQGSDTDKEREILYWRAPMDPTEIYEKPGKSKMGMDLVPVYEGEEAGGAGSITIDGTLQQNMNLRVANVSRKDLSTVVRAYGRVTVAEDRAFSVNTKISGWIEKLHVNTTGQTVKKGQPLLEIYSPELVSAQEEYLLALKNLKDLSMSPYENVRNNAKKMLMLARDRLLYWDISQSEIENIGKTGQSQRTLVLKSQVSGVVTHKGIIEGDKVGPGKELFHIADLREVWIEASIYESELSLIKVGQKAVIELDHLGGKKLEGEIDFIFPYLDEKSRANRVRLVFGNPDLILKPDMDATVRIYSHAVSDSLAIPAEAVIHSGKRKIVFVTMGDGKFEPREIRTGIESEDGFIQVISGLFDHESVVVSGQFLLDSESRTREAIAKMRAAQALKIQDASKEEERREPKTHGMEPEMDSHESLGEMESQKHEISDIDVDRLFICPMHPEFITTDPDARCPECGMDLIKVEDLGEKVDLTKVKFYTCSMHPDFLTTDKDARCPECGMKLEEKKEIDRN